MIQRIHLDPKLEKILAGLRKGDSRRNRVADRVEAIIAEAKRGQLPPEEVAAFTRNGEARIRGARKYDLGAGYRLITLKQSEDLYLLFVGTHDECDRWVDNNRVGLPLELIAERCRTISRAVSDDTSPMQPCLQNCQEPEEDWIPPLSDQDLRVVFSGLLGNK
ncbi:hypothetical protein DSCW_27340 [Desulfosarcina widdelii]|uniref:Toxin RelE n=1 Tax=Desulfosarcina widdelii TaxID=947919 RepID=A0A5K7ZGT8_9BACT|nr:hypothetical protein [Desulfosarcina widdelii]BBO75317.1 hypothetical protein DSCW_27340 [Desulfosarcina widdelii]